MNVLIAGGTGLIGQELTSSFIRDGHSVWVLTRSPQTTQLPGGASAVGWDGRSSRGWGERVSEMDALVNLAGENIGALPWTNERKKRLRSSRMEVGQAIVDAIRENWKDGSRLRVVLQSSGTGYYGVHEDRTFTESSPHGSDFLAGVCVDWENSTQPVEELGIRRVVTRSAVVLSEKGGALARFLYPWRMYLGGRLGYGKQWISWIHMQDEIRAMRFLLEREDAAGVFNVSSPNPVRNDEFGRTLAEVMNRPYRLPVPAFALKALFGEMSTVVLDGQRVLPERLLKLGFRFQFEHLRSALEDLLQ